MRNCGELQCLLLREIYPLILIAELEKWYGLYLTDSEAMTFSVSHFCTKTSVQHPMLPQPPSMTISAHLEAFGWLERRWEGRFWQSWCLRSEQTAANQPSRGMDPCGCVWPMPLWRPSTPACFTRVLLFEAAALGPPHRLLQPQDTDIMWNKFLESFFVH